MPIKKFFKTYYQLPHKNNRVDLVFERGYKNIQVLYNGKEVKRFANAPALFESQEIITPDDAVIHLRFLKDAVDFEVFLDGQQIDNSETSPAKIVDSLRFPVYFGIGWYAMVLIGSAIVYEGMFSFIIDRPELLLSSPIVFNIVTSSAVILIILLANLVTLKRGNLWMYYLALVFVTLDALQGILRQLLLLIDSEGSIFIVVIFFIILPLVFKSALIRSFIQNAAKYRQYIRQKAAQKQKTNESVIDL